jgi:RNA polymerase sigma factor (sigma-70 family)
VSEQQVPSTTELVRAARGADAAAWRALVVRFQGVVWAVAREHRLSGDDAADVSQAAWLTLAQHLHRLRDPERLAGWLATTARRESLRVIAHRRREEPLFDIESAMDGPESLTVREDSDSAVWRALQGLPARCQALLRLIAHSPELSYAQAARALGIRVNSVGQTRARCLAGLRRRLECDGLIERVAR